MRGWLNLIFAALLLAGTVAAANAQVVELVAADVSGPDASFHPVSLPHDWEDTWPGYSGTATYRLRFDAPPARELLGVYIERACTNVQATVNGELVGSGGSMAPPVTRNCYHPQLFPIPRSLLQPAGNVLELQVVGHAATDVVARQRAAGLSAVQVGRLQLLQPVYDRQLFWNVTMAQIITAVVAALGVAILGLALLRRKDTYLLYFGLFAAGWALIGARLFVRDVPFDATATEILICSAFTPVLGCAYLFLLRLVDRRWRWFERLLLAQGLFAPVVLWLAAPHHLLPVATAVYNTLAAEFLLATAAFFTVAWRERRSDFWLMAGVLLLAVGLAAIEIALQNRFVALPPIHVIHFALPLVLGVIGIRLVQLFVQALNRAEQVNEQLEERVAQKSREIERSWMHLTQLRTAEAALEERRRIASDLHDDLGAKLLTIAQAGGMQADRERIATLARQALDEMRLSVRGLTAEPAAAADVLADWRSECVSRLVAAGIEPLWAADEPAQALLLPARTHVQCTRILREAVSNVIRHSGATRCEVRVALLDGGLGLQVGDDGQGLDTARRHAGHGLAGMERRVRSLAGRLQVVGGSAGGTSIVVWVPLPAVATVTP